MAGVIYHGSRLLDCSEAIVGDRMDMDIVAGTESGIDTVLVLGGITRQSDLERDPYKPHHVLKDLGEIPL